MLIKLPEELKSLERYELEKLKKEPEVLEKLIKLAGEGGVADNFTEGDEFPEERAGGARETEVRAGGAREAEEIADNFTEGDEFPEENAAVLERLEKNGATRMNETDRVRWHPSSLFYEFVIDH